MNLLFRTIASIFLLLASISVAMSDHHGTTNAANDPIADLADLYAFVDPHCVASAGAGCEADPVELIVALKDSLRGKESKWQWQELWCMTLRISFLMNPLTAWM